MTAGRSAGTEQGQGRCSAPDCWYTLPVVDGLIVPHSAPMTLDNCEGSSLPPARDSGRDEAREAVARWLWAKTSTAPDVDTAWDLPGFGVLRELFENRADELLSLPEVVRFMGQE